MRRSIFVRSAAAVAACTVTLLAPGCRPEQAHRPDAPAGSTSSDPLSSTVTSSLWAPVTDPGTSIRFVMPVDPVRQSSDRITSTGSHLIATQYQAFVATTVLGESISVIVTPFRVSGGRPSSARSVVRGLRETVVANGARHVRMWDLHRSRVQGRAALSATMTFTTKDRQARGYWRIIQVTGPHVAVLVQVQVSGRRLTGHLTRDGDTVMRKVTGSLRLPTA